MEIKQVFLKTRAEFGKQCIFDVCGPNVDMEIMPDPNAMANYIRRTHRNVGVQHTKQFALHEAQTVGTQAKSSGMFHFEGGWPKEINPKDEEATARFRRRVEKDEDWAPKLRNLFQQMEYNILQNGALNIYEHYFDDMVPTELVKPRRLRTVNVYEDPQTPMRPVNNISWSPDSGSKMVVSYCSFGIEPDHSNIAYIWQIDNPNKPWMALEAPSNTVVSEFNPRDPSVLASGLMSGQVCSWDIRTGTSPVQMSHRQFSHRDFTTVVKWITTKSNTEFFSGSSDGRAMWWDTRNLRRSTEILVFDLQTPNEPDMNRAIGVASADYEPTVGTKFMFGLENGVVISGSKKARTPAEKLALRFNAHYGPVLSVDRNSFNPKIFLTVGDCTARVWTEDTKDSLVSTRFLVEDPVCGCWNKTRHSIFYVATRIGVLTVWDLLVGLRDPILTMKLCEQKLTAVTSHEAGALLAVGNSAGNVYLVESSEALYTFDKNERNDLMSYLERCSYFVKAIDTRLKEIKLKTMEETSEVMLANLKDKKKDKRPTIDRNKRKMQEKLKEPREKSRFISKRKLKDEFPELQEVEDKFFEIVKKEKQKYIEDEDPEFSAIKTRSIKKIVSRKIDKDSHVTIQEAEIVKKMPSKKIFKEDKEKYPKKVEISEISVMEAQYVEQEKTIVEEPLPALAIVEPPVKKISERKRRKKLRKKRSKLAAFKLPRPCKIGICKPKICCRKTIEKLKIRSTDRAVKDREKRDEVDVRTRTSIESKKKMRQKRRRSWTKLLRIYKRKGLTREYDKEKISLQEMMAPSEELALMMEDVKRAKREIQEIGRARTKIRKPVKKTWESRAKVAEESRDPPRKSEKNGREDEEVTRMPKSFPATEKPRKVCRRMAVKVDPCVPWKPPSLAKDLQTFLAGPLPESIEKKEKPDVVCLEEMEVSRSRVYPRISDFHSVE